MQIRLLLLFSALVFILLATTIGCSQPGGDQFTSSVSHATETVNNPARQENSGVSAAQATDLPPAGATPSLLPTTATRTSSTATVFSISTRPAPPAPSRTPTSTRSAITAADSANYVAIGQHLWQPQNERLTESLPIDTGGQPWSPDGTQLVGYDRSHGGLSILELITGRLTPLEGTTPTASRPYWSPNERHLAYIVPVAGGENLWQVAVYDFETELETALTEAMSSLTLVELIGWSFDSQRVAFIHWTPSVQDPEGVALLTVLSVESKQRVDYQAPAPFSLAAASWSPVDLHIVAYGTDTERFGRPNPAFRASSYEAIYMIDVAANSMELVRGPEDPGSTGYPYYENRARYSLGSQPWAPDGASFVYAEKGQICIYNFNDDTTTCPEKLSEVVTGTGAAGAQYPGWSPSGDWIGFLLFFESVFCSPLAAAAPDGHAFSFTDAERGDCAAEWGVWSPQNG